MMLIVSSPFLIVKSIIFHNRGLYALSYFHQFVFILMVSSNTVSDCKVKKKNVSFLTVS